MAPGAFDAAAAIADNRAMIDRSDDAIREVDAGSAILRDDTVDDHCVAAGREPDSDFGVAQDSAVQDRGSRPTAGNAARRAGDREPDEYGVGVLAAREDDRCVVAVDDCLGDNPGVVGVLRSDGQGLSAEVECLVVGPGGGDDQVAVGCAVNGRLQGVIANPLRLILDRSFRSEPRAGDA